MQPNSKIFLTRNWHEEAINFLREKKYEVITWDNKNPPTFARNFPLFSTKKYKKVKTQKKVI